MTKHLLKTFVAMLAIAAAAANPAWGQNTMAVWPQTAYGDLQTGDTVVILDKTSAKALPSTASSTTPSTVLVTLNSAKDTLTSTPAANLLWVVTKNGNTYQFKQPGSSNYLYFIDYSNGVRVGNSNDNQFTFQIGGAYNVPFLKHNATSSYLGLNDAGEWRSAGSISTTSTIKNTVIGFYKKTVIIIPTYTVRFASGNDGWSVKAVSATTHEASAAVTAPAVLQNVMAGDSLVVTAPASLPGKVKSVKAVKYVPPAATVTTAPTATEAYIAANSTSALVNAGAANGGTMMYAVTTTNAQPASTADFSATRPTAQGRTAGTYYVWYYAKADANHSDSEIAGPVSVTLAVMTTVTWNSSNVFNSAHQHDELNQWNTNPLTYVGITISMSGDYVSSFKPYDSHLQIGSLECHGDEGDSFTFTAPSGKKFCKIEIINNGGIIFTNYGDWTGDVINNKIVWSGTAATAVTLGTVFTVASELNSIVFKLIDAQ